MNKQYLKWIAVSTIVLLALFFAFRCGECSSRYSFHPSKLHDYIFDKATGKLYWLGTDFCTEVDLIKGERTYRKLKINRE